VSLNFDPVTLIFDLWPLTLNMCNRPASPLSKSVRNLSEIGQSEAELLQLNIWKYDLEHVSRAPLCCGIVCTKFTLSQGIRSWNVTIVSCYTSCHAMNFRPVSNLPYLSKLLERVVQTQLQTFLDEHNNTTWCWPTSPLTRNSTVLRQHCCDSTTTYALPLTARNLMPAVRKSTSIATFKRSLKTFLFEQITHSAH